MLDAVEIIVPQLDDDWKSVSNHYNKEYATKFKVTERTSNALKTKFRELCWGAQSGGGNRNEYETRAKALMKKIDEASGVFLCDNDSSVSTSSPTVSSKIKGSSRIKFQQNLLSRLDKNESIDIQRHQERLAIEEKRHNDRMIMFQKLLDKL